VRTIAKDIPPFEVDQFPTFRTDNNNNKCRSLTKHKSTLLKKLITVKIFDLASLPSHRRNAIFPSRMDPTAKCATL